MKLTKAQRELIREEVTSGTQCEARAGLRFVLNLLDDLDEVLAVVREASEEAPPFPPHFETCECWRCRARAIVEADKEALRDR
jgi:hypothetical protein